MRGLHWSGYEQGFGNCGLPCGVEGEGGAWPLGRTEGNAAHNLLNYPKTDGLREIFTERKWFKIKKEMAF